MSITADVAAARLRTLAGNTVSRTIRELINPANEHARVQLVAYCDGVLAAAFEGGAISVGERGAALDAMAGRPVSIDVGAWWA